MKPLQWFPLDADEWINRTALLSLEATGALLVCVLASWNASVRGDEPGTLPASPEALTRLLGPRAEQVMPVVLQQWIEDPDNPQRLRCAWLAALYAEQLAKHQSIVERARKGGWKKGRSRKPEAGASAIPPASAIPEVFVKQTERERDPVGGSFGAPTTGGVVAAVGRVGATAASPPGSIMPADPIPISTSEVAVWAEQVPTVRGEVERLVEAKLDEENRGWRDRPSGPGLRNRLVEAGLHEAFVRERRRGLATARLPILPSHGSLPGAAYA